MHLADDEVREGRLVPGDLEQDVPVGAEGVGRGVALHDATAGDDAEAGVGCHARDAQVEALVQRNLDVVLPARHLPAPAAPLSEGLRMPACALRVCAPYPRSLDLADGPRVPRWALV